MYYPKNKIKTGLYTNGGEYIYADNKSSFTGYYYALYNGKFYEGKSPTKGNREIIEISLLDSDQSIKTDIRLIDDFGPSGKTESYATIVSTGQKQNVPIPVFRFPQQTDYGIGQFVRYFCRKVNEPVFIEINNSTYTALYNKNQNWVQLYIPFQIYWLIAGDYEKVVQTNRINVTRKEQSLQLYGLTKYIETHGGYDKFYF